MDKSSIHNKQPSQPDSWEVVKLDEVCEILDSRRIPVNSSEREERIQGKSKEDLFPYFGATGQVDFIDSYLFEGEHVLLGEDGAPFLDPFKEKAYIVSGKFWVNNHAHILKAYISNKFLLHYLNQIDYAKYVSGTTRLKLNQSSLRDIDVVFPPEYEQHRIVAKIEELFSELDKGVESLTTAREQLKVYRQALLKHAFEGKLTEQWRAEHPDQLETADELLDLIKKEREKRYQEQLAEWGKAVEEWEDSGKKCKNPARPKKITDILGIASKELGKYPFLPSSWFWGRLGLMTCGVEYGTAAKSSDSGKVPVLRMGNIQNGVFDWGDLVYTSDECEVEKYILSEGDVLFNRTNSPELVGKTAIYQGERPAIFAGYLIRINHIRSSVDSRYLNYFLNSHFAKKHGNSVKTDGVNQSNINGNKLANYPFPFCPIEEQEVIADLLDEQLSVVDKMETDIANQLVTSNALRQSILKKAFSGELVPQDLNDEPASKLLARIKAERDESQQQAKRKPRITKKKKEVITMADLIEVMKNGKDWMSAQEVFRKCGIADGAETDAIEKIYEELRGYVKENKIAVERRGEEDWLRLAQGV